MGIKDKTDFNTCRLLLRSYVVQMIRKGNVHLEVQNLMKFENVHNYLLQQLRLTIACVIVFDKHLSQIKSGLIMSNKTDI